jgi:hypothetical protein
VRLLRVPSMPDHHLIVLTGVSLNLPASDMCRARERALNIAYSYLRLAYAHSMRFLCEEVPVTELSLESHSLLARADQNRSASGTRSHTITDSDVAATAIGLPDWVHSQRTTPLREPSSVLVPLVAKLITLLGVVSFFAWFNDGPSAADAASAGAGEVTETSRVAASDATAAQLAAAGGAQVVYPWVRALGSGESSLTESVLEPWGALPCRVDAP